MARHDKNRLGFIATAACLLCAGNAQAEVQTLSQQLLYAYFDTAGVCTTSQVDNIRDDGSIVTIEIVIDPDTRSRVEKMQNPERDGWFSLHCPPEIHGVWRQQDPPDDVLVSGLVSEDESYTLSCIEFQNNQWGTRKQSLRDRIQQWLEEKLED